MAKTPANRIFKLRYPNGLFSTGGSRPHGDERGKSWNHVGHIKSHLRQGARYPQGMEIVTFELVEVEAVSLQALREEELRKQREKEAREAERRRKEQERQAKLQEEREKRELARLKAKYPDA